MAKPSPTASTSVTDFGPYSPLNVSNDDHLNRDDTGEEKTPLHQSSSSISPRSQPSTEEAGLFQNWFASSKYLDPSRSDGLALGYTPATVLLLAVGFGSAVAHHVHYSKLDGEIAGDAGRQAWTLRIGTGLAFLFRATIPALVGISRKQWLCVTLRKRSMKLKDINAIFGVASDPFNLNRNMLLRAKLTTLMALFI